MSGFWAVFFKQELSGLSVFSKKKRPNRSNRSDLAGKPLKPPISWAVFERDLDPGNEEACPGREIVESKKIKSMIYLSIMFKIFNLTVQR